ncbi:MAG: hypothetical protein FWF71_08020 [Actinomycetia bacterium]|nr:hypothetical protein [Actinomycetes bacterium]
MSEATLLYALKCDAGYIKVEAGSFRVVGFSKASVFDSLDKLPAFAEQAREIKGLRAVELRIVERDLEAL